MTLSMFGTCSTCRQPLVLIHTDRRPICPKPACPGHQPPTPHTQEKTPVNGCATPTCRNLVDPNARVFCSRCRLGHTLEQHAADVTAARAAIRAEWAAEGDQPRTEAVA